MMSHVVKTVPPSEEDPKEEDSPRPMLRSGKQPMQRQWVLEDSSEGPEDALPDVNKFFDDHGTSPEDRVKICRACASYNVSILPPKAKKEKAKPNKELKRSRE